MILAPMARAGAEPIGSMGSDTSIAVLSDRSRLLYDYFTQLFAQVTNPPLDAIREELVTSLSATIGPEANLLEACQGSCRQILLPLPVIDRDDLAKLMYVNEHGETPGFKAFAIDGLFEVPARRGRRVRRRPPAARRCGAPSTATAAAHEVSEAIAGAPTSSSSRTATRRPTGRPSRRCCSPRPCTTTWCARRHGPRSAWWSRPATPARCTTWRCSSATGRRRSTRTSPSTPSTT